MGGSVIFYTYGNTLELNGQQLTAGMLTADLLNLSPDEYMRLKKRMTQITDLAEEYERKRDICLLYTSSQGCTTSAGTAATIIRTRRSTRSASCFRTCLLYTSRCV